MEFSRAGSRAVAQIGDRDSRNGFLGFIGARNRSIAGAINALSIFRPGSEYKGRPCYSLRNLRLLLAVKFGMGGCRKLLKMHRLLLLPSAILKYCGSGESNGIEDSYLLELLPFCIKPLSNLCCMTVGWV